MFVVSWLQKLIKVILITVVVVAGYCLITTPGAKVATLLLLVAASRSHTQALLEILNRAVVDTGWPVSWDRYPTPTGARLREKIFLILCLSSWVCLRPWDLKGESSRIVIMKMGCNCFQDVDCSTLRASGSEDAAFQLASCNLTCMTSIPYQQPPCL